MLEYSTSSLKRSSADMDDTFETKDGMTTLLFPEARVRTIMKINSDVQRFTKDAACVLNKACELYLKELSRQALAVHTANANIHTDDILGAADILATAEYSKYANFLKSVFYVDEPTEEVKRTLDVLEETPHTRTHTHTHTQSHTSV
eukprot:GHVR01048360.1.p1 GENE.GHVR01048360.1~~GHVR01048360.1.p1  ORF type:complete len:147 (-),score=56.13 GHVR01048360.1:5-445(-)